LIINYIIRRFNLLRKDSNDNQKKFENLQKFLLTLHLWRKMLRRRGTITGNNLRLAKEGIKIILMRHL